MIEWIILPGSQLNPSQLSVSWHWLRHNGIAKETNMWLSSLKSLRFLRDYVSMSQPVVLTDLPSDLVALVTAGWFGVFL